MCVVFTFVNMLMLRLPLSLYTLQNEHWYSLSYRRTDTYNFHNIAINVSIYIMCNCEHGIGCLFRLFLNAWLWNPGCWFCVHNLKLRLHRWCLNPANIKLTGFDLDCNFWFAFKNLLTETLLNSIIFSWCTFSDPFSTLCPLSCCMPHTTECCALNCCNYFFL